MSRARAGALSSASASPGPAQVDEGSITAWATLSAAMAEAAGTLEHTDGGELVGALESGAGDAGSGGLVSRTTGLDSLRS